ETRALVGDRLGVDRVDDPLVELIFGKSDGLPFFTEELTSALRERSLLRTDDGVARLATTGAASAALDLPNTIQGVVTSRIDKLSAPEQLTLKVASVLGRVFDLGGVRAVHPVTDDGRLIREHVEAAVARDIVHPLGDGAA